MITELFQYEFFINALWAALFSSITCGIIGAYIVSNRIVFLSGGITHSSFGGIGIGYYLGINPILGAAVFSVLSGLGIEFFSRKGEVRYDSMIGIWWSLGMALGIIFIYLTPGYAPNLMTYLFGSILSVSTGDLIFMAILAGVVILFFILFYHTILFISFDESYARVFGLPVNAMKNILIGLVALTIVINIKVVGIILLISLLTIPQAIANHFTQRFEKMIYYSTITAFVGVISGLLFSYQFDVPSGAFIIFALVVLFALVKLVLSLKKRFFTYK
ncbi:MAG: metal ABC transporter permease [Bacteroidales bacterium]|nr:metal ABC transporter permease [Bacteroidales bacterium]